MKLISMTDFVLSQEQPTYLQSEEFEEAYYKLHNYANFLKQPLTLGMFVPCDENGNVLEEPNRICNMNWGVKKLEDWSLNYYEYQQAKERILFEGFEIVKDNYKSIEREFIYIPNTKTQIWRKLTYHSGKVETFFFDYYDEFKTVENLIKYNLTLTESAIKKLGI